MKKLVFASAAVLAGMCLLFSPALRSQESGQVSLPADQYNAYQNAITQSTPAAKAAALEGFLQAYPQSAVKDSVLDQLIDTYEQMNDPEKALSAATRLLQIEPNNFDAIFATVFLKKLECQRSLSPATGESQDPQTCDDAAAMAQKGLTLAKPADVSDEDWKKRTDTAYPIFDSAIALDDVVVKRDYGAAIKEYNTELMLYPAAQTTSGNGLVDTLNLAEAYAKPGASRDEVKAIWFYARAWNFAPTSPHDYKADIEPKLEYWYKRFHGGLDGLDAVKTAAEATLFPPAGFVITPAPTPAEVADKVVSETPDLTTLSLEDKEFILANGSAADTQKLWAVLQNQVTPVPGIVIADPADVLNVAVTTTHDVKPKEFVVHLTTAAPCGAVPTPPSDLRIKEAQGYILSNGVKADTDAMGDLLTDVTHVRRIAIEPAVSVIKMAVTQDAKDSHVADFIVNMKTPVGCKEAPAPGFEFKLLPAEELNATYSTYQPISATTTKAASAQIVLNDGFIQEQKAAPVHHKPSPAHHTPH